ncbi:MAG: helix-turn-helix domain-containing protein [Bacillota bacterium]
MYVSVATELVLLRHARRLPMRAYARELGISQPALVDLERGRNYPSCETLRAYARLVGVPADHLVEAQEQDRALAALTAPPPLAGSLFCAAVGEITRLSQVLGPDQVSEADLAPEAFLKLQHHTVKSVRALQADPALARCWKYLARHVLSRVHVSALGLSWPAELCQPAVAAAALMRTDVAIGNPRDRADLVRLCFARVTVALGPGQALGLEFEGISRAHDGG